MFTGGDKQNELTRSADADHVSALTEQLKAKDLTIQILSAQLAAKEARLEQITRSFGWQIVNRYSWLKYYLGPIYNGFARLFGHDAPVASPAVKEAALVFPPATDYDVICFPIIDWHFRFQRPQQLLSQFARDGHRVFYLSTTFHQSGPDALAKAIGNNIFELQLPGPAHLSANLHKINKATLSKLFSPLDRFRQTAGIGAAVSFVHLPFWGPLAIQAREHWGWKVVYDCMDEHSGFSNIRHAALAPEQEVIQHSDLVIVTSRVLYEKITDSGRTPILVPNAVDFDYFQQPGPLRLLDKIRRPIIGYYGAISDWFDVEMIHHAASQRPAWQFVLVGDTAGAKVSALKRLPNVHLLGEQPYITLSSYLKDFDVACIPFLVTPLTRATNPVKFYEYLSTGKPVVAVDLPELEPYREHFYPVRSKADFIAQTEAALTERAPEKVRARIELARSNTWLDRYRILKQEIARLRGV